MLPVSPMKNEIQWSCMHVKCVEDDIVPHIFSFAIFLLKGEDHKTSGKNTQK